jgi:hypothetical protein
MTILNASLLILIITDIFYFFHHNKSFWAGWILFWNAELAMVHFYQDEWVTGFIWLICAFIWGKIYTRWKLLKKIEKKEKEENESQKTSNE